MDKNSIELSIIIPAYLEEENLRNILPRINKALSGLSIDYEVLVIDTLEPMDNTEKVCSENKAIYIKREDGNFYGDGVRTGIKHAKGKYIIFMDADGSHSPEFIENLYRLKEDYDIVIASRYIDGGNTDNSKLLIFMSLIVNIIYAKVLNLDCKDVSNSFKLYRAELLKDIRLYSRNFDIVEEILVRLKKRHCELKIKEIPYTFKKRMFGSTKRNLFLFSISYIKTLLKLKFVA